MTAKELQKRNEKAQSLRVIQVDDTWFYVESEEGKICYKVCFVNADEVFCTCADFARGSKADPAFKCKHLLAVMNCVPNGEFETAEYLEKRKPKLEERFITTIDGKDFVYYAGLLDLAHQKNLVSMEVETLQLPSKENEHTAICRAIAQTSLGGKFVDIGDANPLNCNSRVSRHIIRMASTRAKARCLRDLTNVGMTSLEELGDFNEVIGANQQGKTQEKKTGSKKVTKPEKQPQPGKPEEKEKGPADAKVGKSEESKPDVSQGQSSGNEKQASETVSPKSEGNGNDNGNGKGKKDPPKISSAQKNAICNLSRRRGISMEQVEKMSIETYGLSLDYLSATDASSFIRQLQQAS